MGRVGYIISGVKKLSPSISIAILTIIIAAVFIILNPLKVIQWKFSDLLSNRRGTSDLITIIAIDDKSISPEGNLGRFKDWPRSYYAQLLRSINGKKPAVVAFDLDFREGSRGMSDLRVKQFLREQERRLAVPGSGGLNWYELIKKFEGNEHPDDVDFLEAMNESGPVVLTSSLIFSGAENETSSEFPAYQGVFEPIFKGDKITAGYKNVFMDRDGVLRRFVPKTADETVSFAYAIAKSYKPDFAAGVKNGESALINYAAKPFSYRTISFIDALSGNYDPAAIAGKIVIVGATARILQDLRATPTSRNAMPGVEINANMAQQLLENSFISEQSKLSLILLCIILAFAGGFAFFKLNLKYIWWIFGGVILAIPLAAFLLYKASYSLNIIYTEMTWIVCFICAMWYRNQTEFKEKKEIKNAFAHYVNPTVVNELAKNPENLKLGGKRQEISVLFSDIVGFTSIAEKLTPEDTVALLNDYLSAMTEVVFTYNGTLDKYQGDAIMALFGAPILDRHHAINACLTALNMRKALTGLHEKWNAISSLPFKEELLNLDFRVGISSGQAIVGNVGSAKRFDYTAIGDIVNLGSRLESLNRKYGTKIMIDKTTFTAITDNHNPFTFRKLDIVRVKGKENETEVFEVVGPAETLTDNTRSMLDDFENGRILYTQRNFIEAKQYFESAMEKVVGDGPSQIYLNRCSFFLRNPPGRDWSAIVDLEEK